MDDSARFARPTIWINLALVVMLCAAYAWRPISGSCDFWAHAAIGRWIMTNHAIPTHTLFLFTYHAPWIAHSWLSEVIFYKLMTAGSQIGPYLVDALTCLVIGAAFAIVYYAGYGRRQARPWTLLLFAIAIQGSAFRFQPRPEIFSDLGLVLVLWMLVSIRATSDERRVRLMLCGLPVLIAVWTNLHGAAVTGLVLVAATCAADCIQYRFDSRSRGLCLALAASCVAMCVNPYGLRYFSIYSAINSVTFAHIAEWQPLFGNRLVPAFMLVDQAILLIAAVYAWSVRPGRRFAELAWLIVTGAMFARAVRAGIFFDLTALLLIAAPSGAGVSAKAPDDTADKRDESASGSGDSSAPADRGAWSWQRAARCLRHPAWTVGAAVVVLAWSVLAIRAAGPTLAPASYTDVPSRQMAFIMDNDITGRALADYNITPYAEWAFGDSRPLYIDNVNAYPPVAFEDYMHMQDADDRGRMLLDWLHIDFVIGREPTTADGGYPPLYRYLMSRPEWALVYRSYDDGPLWVRRIPRYRALWEAAGT